MINPSLFEYYREMGEHHVIIELKGVISQDILVGFVELIRNKLSQESEGQRVVKRVFSVFVELVQNVVHHSAESVVLRNTENRVGKGIVMLRDDNDVYVISSGNLVENSRVAHVADRCDKINELDNEGLRRFYKEQLKFSRKEGQDGGGVGLINVARQSGDLLEYEISTVDDLHSFFTISVKIGKGAGYG
jgi:hypothetical protein